MRDLKEFLVERNIEFYQHQEIKPFTTIKIGGKVQNIIVITNLCSLEELLVFLHHHNQSFVLLGGGSNVIFPDQAKELIVIINRSCDISKIDHQTLKVNSGITNSDLLSWSIDHQVGGLEFLAGIPGSIGGAAAVNAGAFGRAMADILARAEIFTKKGERKTVGKDYFRFTYRDSIFKFSDEVILNLYLNFHEEDSAEIRKAVGAALKYRKKNHPSSQKYTAGCFFKNPTIDNQKISAGKLIENTGLKGFTYKNLFISQAHGNFLINQGEATFAEISLFAEDIRQQVYKKQGILLEREVIYISPQGKKY